MSATKLVEKRCDCGDQRWPKCAHPWYMVKFRYNGGSFEPNLTRYALEVLHTELVTKTDADALAEKVRTAIRDGSYVSAKTKKATIPITKKEKQQALFADARKLFGSSVVDADTEKRETTKAGDKSHLAVLGRFKVERDGRSYKIDELPVDAVSTNDLIAFRDSDRMRVLANSSWAKYRTTFGQFFAWARSKGYCTDSPLAQLAPHEKKKLKRGDFARRERRLEIGEEALLLKAAGRTRADDATALRLQGMIVAALEAALRHGECLALQWGDVELARRQLLVRAIEVGARKTGEGKSRWVPISDRLADELTAIQNDPATGKLWRRDAYVFGDETGGRVKSVKKAWATLVLRAHGFEPKWNGTKMSPVSQRQLAKIDREFKDLRRECALRWYESGKWDLLQIRDALGHATVETTEIYLNIPRTSPADAMRRFDEQRAADERAAEKQRRRQGLKVVSGVGKLSANGKADSGGGTVPRLVKHGKSRGGV